MGPFGENDEATLSKLLKEKQYFTREGLSEVRYLKKEFQESKENAQKSLELLNQVRRWPDVYGPEAMKQKFVQANRDQKYFLHRKANDAQVTLAVESWRVREPFVSAEIQRLEDLRKQSNYGPVRARSGVDRFEPYQPPGRRPLGPERLTQPGKEGIFKDAEPLYQEYRDYHMQYPMFPPAAGHDENDNRYVEIQLNPSDVRFSVDTLEDRFECGRSLRQVLKGLVDKPDSLRIYNIDPCWEEGSRIQVYWNTRCNEYFVYPAEGNKRLWVFQQYFQTLTNHLPSWMFEVVDAPDHMPRGGGKTVTLVRSTNYTCYGCDADFAHAGQLKNHLRHSHGCRKSLFPNDRPLSF